MNKKRILVTGANGLLGSNLCSALKSHHDVFALVRKATTSASKGVHYIEIDLSSDWSLNILPANMDIVIHLAQSERFREFPDHAMDVFNVNVASTMKLLDYSRKAGVKKFLYASTGGIYDTSLGAVSENSPITTFGSLGNYFASKLCSEILTHNYTSFFDVNIMRLFFMYGSGQKRGMLIPRLVDNVRNGNPIRLSKGGGIQINPVHVQDVVTCIKKMFDITGSFTYNIAGPEVLSLEAIAGIISEKTGKEPVFEHTESIANNCVADISFLGSKLYAPQRRLVDHIQELL